MRARVGEWLVVEGEAPGAGRRQGEIVEVAHPDGSPPYRVHWVDDGRTSLVFPGPGARIEPHPVAPAVRAGRHP